MLHVMICHYTPVYYNMYIIIYIMYIYTLYTYLWFSIIFPNQFDFLSSRLELSRWPQDHRAHHWTSDPEKGSSNLSHSVTLEVDVHDPYKLWSFTLTTPHNISKHYTTSQNTTQHLKTSHNISQCLTTSQNIRPEYCITSEIQVKHGETGCKVMSMSQLRCQNTS